MVIPDLRRVASVLALIPGLVACSSTPPGPTDATAQLPPPVPAPGATPPVAGGPAAVPPPPGTPPGALPANAQAKASGGATERAAAAPASTAGLVTLPSARQVIDALPLGRRDPFASPFPPPPAPAAAQAGVPPRYRNALPGALTGQAAAAGGASAAAGGAAGATAAAGPDMRLRVRPAPLVPPDGFRVTGLIRAGRGNEAVVEYQNLTGSLRRGDRGGQTTDLLPQGWSVASVDVNQGRHQVMVDL